MSSIRFASLGKGEFLPSLRGDLKRAKQSLSIICPWIDEYFANEVALACTAAVRVSVIMRPEESVDDIMWPHMVGAVSRLNEHFESLAVHTLEYLHAKSIIIDDEIAYVGSTNFYRFSLEDSKELALRGPLKEMGNLAGAIKKLLEDSVVYKVPVAKSKINVDGVKQEIYDPIVRNILAKNPKAWVIGPKPKK
jgi:hypothetical protein